MPLFPFLSNAFSFTISSTLAYMLNYYYVAYVQIPYYKRIGHTKVRMLRDSLRVIQYIVSAILYYNPIKMFLIMAIALVLGATPVTILGLATGLTWLTVTGLVLLGMTVPVFAAGLMVEAHRQYILHPLGNVDQPPMPQIPADTVPGRNGDGNGG